MSNFIFVSPDFPQININLCEHLAASGVRVLGIGDAEYDGLDHRLKSSLAEYYRVTSLEDYGEVYRAVAYFAHTYGKPSRLESNNSYWLSQDAQLRRDFNIPGIIWGSSDADSLDIVREAGIPTGEASGPVLSWDGFVGAEREVLFEGITAWPAVSSTEYAYRTLSPVPEVMSQIGRDVATALRAKLTFLHVQIAFPPDAEPRIIRVSRSAPPAFTLDMHNYAQELDSYQVYSAAIASLDPLLNPVVPQPNGNRGIAVYASRQDDVTYHLHANALHSRWQTNIRLVERNPEQYRRGMGDTFYIAVVDTDEAADNFIADVTKRAD